MIMGGSLACIDDYIMVGCLHLFEGILETCRMWICLMEHDLKLLDNINLDVSGQGTLVFGLMVLIK